MWWCRVMVCNLKAANTDRLPAGAAGDFLLQELGLPSAKLSLWARHGLDPCEEGGEPRTAQLGLLRRRHRDLLCDQISH